MNSPVTPYAALRAYIELRDSPTSTQEDRNAAWTRYWSLASVEMKSPVEHLKNTLEG